MSGAADGRPLRALLLLLLCWAGGRMVAAVPVPGEAMALVFRPEAPRRAVFPITPTQAIPPATGAVERRTPAGETPDDGEPLAMLIIEEALLDLVGLGAMATERRWSALSPSPPQAEPGTLPAPAATEGAAADRWWLDAWLLWREGGGGSIGLGGPGQLGASQAGARLNYDLTPGGKARLAAYARVTSALGDPAAPEAGVGIAYQPDRAIPFTIGVERRIGLGDGGRSAFAIVGAAGFGPSVLPLGLQVEGYGQAGVVGLRRRDAFVDGKLSVLRPIKGGRFAAGASLSGGAQPHLSRLDIGPEVQARFTLAGRPARISAEWRQRVAGNARPGSGLTVTLSSSF